MNNADDGPAFDADDFTRPPRYPGGPDAMQLRDFVFDAIAEGVVLLFGIDPDGGLILLEDPLPTLGRSPSGELH